MDAALLLVIVVGVLLVLFCLIKAFGSFKRKRVIDDTPTSKTSGVFLGIAEVKGTAETDTLLYSHLAKVECVQYSWKIEEQWKRIVVTKNGPRTETGWETIESDGQFAPFYLMDDTGIIRIVPLGATFEGITAFDETCSRDDDLYFSLGPKKEISNSIHKRRFHETAIPVHSRLYVIGQARERQDVVAAEIAGNKAAPVFLISTRTEKEVSRNFGMYFWLWIFAGLICSLGTVLGWHIFQTSGSSLGWLHYIIASAGYLFVSMLAWIWMVYNSFINLHHRVEQAWSQVEIQLKRRNDLIPNLLQIVEGYRAHEKEILAVIAQIRSQMEATPPGQAGPDFKGLSSTLIATVENYPELKANDAFLKLQQSLVDTEHRIALARDYYNEVATYHNTRLEIIPDKWVGILARLHQRTLMSASEFERAPVPVKFHTAKEATIQGY